MTALGKARFKGFWHGPALGPIQKACLATFIERGHQFELFTYEPFDVPDGVEICDASSIIPLSEVFYFSNPFSGKQDLGPFSDLFRFKLLHERGGWYCDVDTVCIAAAMPLVCEAWAQEAPRHIPKAVGAGQLALARGSDLARTLYERCLEISRTKFPRREDLGPKLISAVMEELALPKNMNGSSETFYPVSWIEAFKLWLPEHADEVTEKSRNSYFMPIYQSFPQFIGLDVGLLPPSGSYLGELCDRLAPATMRRYDVADIRDATKRFLASHEWAREELAAYGGAPLLREIDT